MSLVLLGFPYSSLEFYTVRFLSSKPGTTSGLYRILPILRDTGVFHSVFVLLTPPLLLTRLLRLLRWLVVVRSFILVISHRRLFVDGRGRTLGVSSLTLVNRPYISSLFFRGCDKDLLFGVPASG